LDGGFVDLVGDTGWSVRELYAGNFGTQTRQDIYCVKIHDAFLNARVAVFHKLLALAEPERKLSWIIL
jgi:hypothetical protein